MSSTPNLTGFIVEIKSATDKIVIYTYNGKKSQLEAGETFIGYYASQTGKHSENSWEFANLTRIAKLGPNEFKYEGEATFPIDEVTIQVMAKRGPDSNNIGLPPEYDKLDTWYVTE